MRYEHCYIDEHYLEDFHSGTRCIFISHFHISTNFIVERKGCNLIVV